MCDCFAMGISGRNQLGWDAGLVEGPPGFGFVGTTGGPFDDSATALDTDAAGNVYVTGVFREKFDFDLGPGIYELQSCSTDDVFVAKYTPHGALIWARSADGSGADASYGIAVTDAADVIVTGTFEATAPSAICSSARRTASRWAIRRPCSTCFAATRPTRPQRIGAARL